MYPDSRRFGGSCLLLQCLPELKQTGLLVLKKACPECALTWNDIDSTAGSWELAGLNLHHPHLEEKKKQTTFSMLEKIQNKSCNSSISENPWPTGSVFSQDLLQHSSFQKKG